MINIVGAKLQITRKGSLDTVARGQALQAPRDSKNGEFVYFATKAIAGDSANGNGDYFPWEHLLKSYTSFVGRNLFLNHNSGDPRNAIGKVLDAYPVVDDQTGEKYIECLAKIDKVAHPELARQIEAGILDSCSMGCSVESSQCNVCGTTIHSDQDNRCQHMSRGLGREYRAEMDFPEMNVKKGQSVKAFAINRGLNFTELSVVNVPAWDNAKIVQVIAQLKERVAKEPTADVVSDLEEILKMANNLKPEAAAEAVADTKETVAEAPALDTTPKENESRESRLTKIFKEKLSALDYLDLQAFMKKETEKISPAAAEATKEEVVAPEIVTKEAAEEKKCECKKDESCKMCKKEEAKEEKKAEAEVKVEVTAEAVAPEAAAAPAAEAVAATEAAPAAEATTEPVAAEATKNDGRKLKAIFVSKANAKESYWVVTDDGKPVLKATLADIWGDNVDEVMDYAPSPLYGEALLTRVREDGVKKVALITNATIYTEAAGGKGDLWPSQKSVGKDQYSPAGPEGSAKMKKLPEGTDMSGGDTGAGSTGPTGGKGDQYPTSKSVGKSQYKPAGGGGPKVKSEKASAENTDGKIEVTAEAEAPAEVAKEAAPAAMPPMEMEMPKEDAAPKGDMPPMDAPKGDGKAMKPLAEMSPEEMLATMKEIIELMDPSKKTAKPLAAVEKAVEKLDTAMTKEQEAAAKEAEKEAAAAAKEAEKAAKEAEKDAKKAEKDAPKEEKAEAPKEDKKEDKKDEKKDEKPEKESEKKDDDKKEMPEGMKKEASEEAPVVEATVELDLPSVSERERELEAQLANLKLEQSLRAKAQKCQAIVSEMVEKDLLAADESDIQEEIANGKPLFDARASAFKKAIDKQCRDLLAMEETALTAFSMTVKRVKGRSATSGGVLKKAFKLHFDEHTGDDAWLNDAFNQMGSQKGKKGE